ncbi:MAG TPA: two-component sensor histidine kinase, partial [Flavobacterium sp.]|nr:two-component sensor histidine kinase [Flavobacterium sp.]
MNKLFFKVLVLLMSLSLIGIILVQVYWFNTSLKNNDEQFKFHVKSVIGSVAEKLQEQEAYSFFDKYNRYKDSTGKIPQKVDLLEFYYIQKNHENNTTTVYSSILKEEDFGITSSIFGKKLDSVKFKSFNSKRVTEVYNNNKIDNSSVQQDMTPDIKTEKSGSLDVLDKAQFEIFFKDIASTMPLQERVSKEDLEKLLKKELVKYGVNTKFEFGVFSSGLATKVKSDGFVYDANNTYSIPIFSDNEGNNKYQLLVSFPNKKKFLLSDLVGITLLS